MTFFRWGSRNAGRPERKSLFGLSLADPCSTLSLREASRFPSEIGNRESRAPLRVQGGIANRSFKINTLTCPHVFHYVLRKSVRIIVRGHERTEQTRTHTQMSQTKTARSALGRRRPVLGAANRQLKHAERVKFPARLPVGHAPAIAWRCPHACKTSSL